MPRFVWTRCPKIKPPGLAWPLASSTAVWRAGWTTQPCPKWHVDPPEAAKFIGVSAMAIVKERNIWETNGAPLGFLASVILWQMFVDSKKKLIVRNIVVYRCMYIYICTYIYMVPPPVPTLFVLLLVFTVFFAYFGVYMFLTFFQINLDIVSRGSTIYIYNRGCRQTCETWWFWHQEVLGGPRTSLEPRTKNQDCTESLGNLGSWFLVPRRS